MLALTILRSLAFNLAFYANIVVWMLLAWPIFLLPRRWGWKVVDAWARSNLFLARTLAGIRLEVRGREHIPPGGCIVAAKHQSAWETFALIPLFDDPAYILKRELLYLPLFGWFCMKMKMIPVDRGRGSAALRAMSARAAEELASGRQILIFPEGTRRPVGAPPAYKFGVAHLYRSTGAPCLPVALNSGLFWPRRRFLRHPGTITMEILEPMPPGLPVEAFQAELERRIENASNRLAAEALARHPDLPAPPGIRATAPARA